MLSKSLLHQINSLAAVDREISSASVVDVVTVRCFEAFQSIAAPNSFIRYPSELLRVPGWSAKAASAAARKTWDDSVLMSNRSARVAVPLR